MAEKEQVVISYPDNHQPLPKQQLGHNDITSRIKGMKGSFASGKSYWLIYELLMHLEMYPGNECVYGRLTMDEITRTFFPIWDEMCPQQLILSHNKQERKIVVRTPGKPSVLHYMPLDDNKGAKHKIKSMNLGFVAIDQMEELSEDVLNAFMGRLRRKGTRRQLAFNANPEGHNWIWRRFIKESNKREKIYEMNAWSEDAPVPTDKELEERAKELDKHPEDLLIKDFPHYIQYSDNPYLPMSYLLSMLDMPDEWKKRYLFGKDDAYEGLIYTEFSRDVHIIPGIDKNQKYVRVIAMDYGKQNPMAVLFMDIDRFGNVYIVDEIYQTNLEVATSKMLIRAKNNDKKVHTYVADRSIWKVITPGMPSIGDLYNTDDDVSGWSINWKQADSSPGAVNAGIDIVKQYLRNDEFTDNKTKLFILKDRCPKLVEEIEDYRWKEMATAIMMSKAKNQPEVPRKYKDHAVDALRYGLMHIHRFNIKPNQDSLDLYNFLREYEDNQMRINNVRGWMVA